MTNQEKRWMATGRAIERARDELPQGADLHIEVARGNVATALYMQGDNGPGLRNWEGDTFPAQINMAITYAISAAASVPTVPDPTTAKPDVFQEAVAAYIRSAVNLPIAFLTSGAVTKDRDPLDVMFYWEEPGFGEVAQFNLRDELVESFADDPDLHDDRLAKTVKALRDLADQLAALPKPAA